MARKDFHGRRAYTSSHQSKRGLKSRIRFVIARIRMQLSRLSPKPSATLFLGQSRRLGDGFSFLGLDVRQARNLDANVFPMSHRPREIGKSIEQVKAGE